MIFHTEQERGIRFFSAIMLAFGLALLLPFSLLALTAVPIFGDASLGAKIAVGGSWTGGLLLALLAGRRLLHVKGYIDIDPSTKTVTVYQDGRPARTIPYTDADYLYLNKENRAGVRTGDPNTYTYYHIRLSSLEGASIYESRGELKTRRRAEAIAQAMGLRLLDAE